MILNYALIIAKRLWRQLLRDRRTLGLMILGPMFYIIIFGMAFGGEIENIPIIIINNDSDVIIPAGPINITISSIGHKVVANLQKSTTVIVNFGTDFNSSKNDIIAKKYVAAILIPVNFTRNLAVATGVNSSIELFLDNSNPQVGVKALQALQVAFQDSAATFKSNLGFKVGYAYGEGLKTIDFFAPAIIGLGVFLFSFILIMMNLIDERKKGTLALLLQCPFDKGQIILGYVLAFSILSMVQTTLIIVCASYLYQVNFGTTYLQYLSLYITAVVLGWTSLVLGIFLSSFARTEFQAVQFIPLVLVPAIFLSGIIIPLIQIPEIIRWMSYLIPLSYGVQLLQKIAIEDYVLEIFNIDLWMMIAFFVLLLIGSRLSLKES